MGCKFRISCSCVTKTTAKKPSKPCIFPFRYNGKTYDFCTTDDDDNDEGWCATAVKANGDIQRGNWGHCEDECFNVRLVIYTYIEY